MAIICTIIALLSMCPTIYFGYKAVSRLDIGFTVLYSIILSIQIVCLSIIVELNFLSK